MKRQLLNGVCTLGILMGGSSLAHAQDAGAPAPDQTAASTQPETDADIVVTARRRSESLQQTPVAISVIGGAQLEAYSIKDFAAIAQFTPGLHTGQTTGSAGGSIFLRGIGSSESSPFVDQAVAVNVDGMQVSSALITQFAELDLAQVEVLRGPQALFFGKNSPGGVISITSAEPTRDWTVIARGGYEFKARDKRGELIVSGPLGDSAGLRLAGRYSRMEGYNQVTTTNAGGAIPYPKSRFPQEEALALRGVLKIEPTDKLTVHLRGLYASQSLNGASSSFLQKIACPTATPAALALDACKPDDKVFLTALPARVFAAAPLFSDRPEGLQETRQHMVIGTIDYNLGSGLTFNSITGLYGVKQRYVNLFANASAPAGGLASNGKFGSDQFTQEARLQTDGTNRVDGMIGLFYEKKDLKNANGAYSIPTSALFPQESNRLRQSAFSAFAQLSFKITPELELSGGARYTDERKRLINFLVSGVDVVPRLPRSRVSYKNTSPEITLTYKPNADLMLFASYKRGFKSGGFDGSLTSGGIAANPGRGLDYLPEKVKGGEGGFKMILADRQVTFNMTGYYYDYSDLQVSAYDPTVSALRIVNATGSRLYGIEPEFTWTPRSAPGLAIRASGAWNHATYTRYFADCYTGQTVALGCNLVLNPATNRFTSQDLTGKQLAKAPRWSATLGGSYEFALGGKLMMGTNADAVYTGRYQAGYQFQPEGYQSSVVKIDAGVRVFTEDKQWEVALIGRNLTDKYTLIRVTDYPLTGSGKGGTADIRSDIGSFLSRGREILLQATFRM